jgi:steroid delta-isomerase-like uncharacterized protein
MTEMTDLADQPAELVDPDQARAMLQMACDATWNAHDADALVADLPPDFVMRVVATSEEARGTEEVRRLVESRLRAFPDWHLEVLDAFTAGNRLCGQIQLTGTHEGAFLGYDRTGQRVDVELCCVFRLGDDGRPVEEAIYFDVATMLRQLGLQGGA